MSIILDVKSKVILLPVRNLTPGTNGLDRIVAYGAIFVR
jgi:hypothetical protein